MAKKKVKKKTTSPTQKALNLWAVILIVWSIYRTKVVAPEWVDEFVAKPLVFILPVYIYIKNVEQKKFFPAIWLKTKKFAGDLVLAFFIGLLFLLAAALSSFLKYGYLSFLTNLLPANFQNLLAILSLALATGVSEEILSRGFVLKRLFDESKNIFTSSFFASVLFFILHIPILFTNLQLTGGLLITFMATDLILSLANSFIFLTRRSLILPILIHALYNFSISLYV